MKINLWFCEEAEDTSSHSLIRILHDNEEFTLENSYK